ncbi:hypothetical protein [Ramlibacter sp.]|uniref:pilus assembly PilX family protein n=1 Tax=Ramlibacter sp. TaxID=1917967 RepID=UPI00179C8130|nr:hypothetical protein [Ramlibacter sp.]MBA2674043.1 hypothetical protein [Ramlibacter sp.]
MNGARQRASRTRQRGTMLIIGLIMLVLITLIVLNAFNMSSSNLKAVGNMQMRDEAVAATNQVIERIVSSPFAIAPQAESLNVDINKDGVNDFVIAVARPTCTRAWVASTADPSDGELGPGMSSVSTWNTEWDISATATDVGSGSGASVTIRQGVRVLLTEAQKNASCL